MTDRLWINCPTCDKEIVSARVEDGERLSPSKAIKWHEKAIAHIRREHLRKPVTA